MRVLRGLSLFLLAATVGCGVNSVAGGTTGSLRGGDPPPADIQVTVHHLDGGQFVPVGFGVTAADGSFELVTNKAEGPLWLTPGEYRCTLESVGSPLQIPEEYAQAATTPLKVAWSESDEKLNLEISFPSAQ